MTSHLTIFFLCYCPPIFREVSQSLEGEDSYKQLGRPQWAKPKGTAARICTSRALSLPSVALPKTSEWYRYCETARGFRSWTLPPNGDTWREIPIGGTEESRLRKMEIFLSRLSRVPVKSQQRLKIVRCFFQAAPGAGHHPLHLDSTPSRVGTSRAHV